MNCGTSPVTNPSATGARNGRTDCVRYGSGQPDCRPIRRVPAAEHDRTREDRSFSQPGGRDGAFAAPHGEDIPGDRRTKTENSAASVFGAFSRSRNGMSLL